MTLLDLHSADFENTKPKMNDLLVCGACGAINEVDLVNCVLLTEEKFDALHPDEKRDLSFAVRAATPKLRS